MAVRASVDMFPRDREAQLKGGISWGVSVTPFAKVDEFGNPPVLAGDGGSLPRCENCWGYLNSLCDMEHWAWNCSLCGNLNGLSSDAVKRYALRETCPELHHSFLEFDLPAGNGSKEEEIQARPVYVAAVDLTAPEEFLDLVKSALLAALEALGPGSLFGLMTFSHKIGLYDIQGPVPVVKYILIPPDVDGHIAVEMEDVMPLLSFLAPVQECKERIAMTIEALKPSTSWVKTTETGTGDAVFFSGRGFGAAMDALISYLSSEYGNTFALARVFAFLSGPPDYGAGQLDTSRYGEQYASRGEDADKALLPEQTPFYKDLAAVAAQSGVCIDLFVVTDEYTDLASLKFLSIESGGSLLLYSSTEDSTLPQDLYRLLSRPYAFACVLRLRTSQEFKTGQSYGHFFPDPQYENVQHIICCDTYATYAYDFQFQDSDGFSSNSSPPPVLQIAFQYTTVVLPEKNTGHDLLHDRSHYSLRRKLRIRTVQYSVAQDIRELQNSANTEVILSILIHKVIMASLENGIREGRILLTDWLVILTAQYNNANNIIEFGKASVPSQVDSLFQQCPQLQPLPRIIFALLRNPLLRLHEEGVHPDYRIYLQCLFSALEPSSLLRAVYPLLSSYSNPDKQAYPVHSLSRAALITSGSPIFFLDAFTTLIVYYSSTADLQLAFPPPQNCLLRSTINKLKQERSITPKLLFLRSGHDNAEIFENYLIEEQDVDGNMGMNNGNGFGSFLRRIEDGVLDYLNES